MASILAQLAAARMMQGRGQVSFPQYQPRPAAVQVYSPGRPVPDSIRYQQTPPTFTPRPPVTISGAVTQAQRTGAPNWDQIENAYANSPAKQQQQQDELKRQQELLNPKLSWWDKIGAQGPLGSILVPLGLMGTARRGAEVGASEFAQHTPLGVQKLITGVGGTQQLPVNLVTSTKAGGLIDVEQARKYPESNLAKIFDPTSQFAYQKLLSPEQQYKGAYGFLGDVALDPLTYINPIPANQILAGGDKALAEAADAAEQAFRRVAAEGGDVATAAAERDAAAEAFRRTQFRSPIHGRPARERIVSQAMVRDPEAYKYFKPEFLKGAQRGFNVMSPEARRALGIADPALHIIGLGTEVPGTRTYAKALSLIGGAARAAKDPYAMRLPGISKLFAGPQGYEAARAVLSRGVPEAKAGVTAEEAGLVARSFYPMRKASGEVTALGNSIGRDFVKETKGYSALANARMLADSELDPNNITPLNRAVARIADAYDAVVGPGNEIPRRDPATHLPHIFAPGARRMFDKNLDDPIVQWLKQAEGFKKEDLLEGSPYVEHARVFQPNADGTPGVFPVGNTGKTLVIERGDIGELNQKFKELFPGFKGKFYLDNPKLILKEYIRSLAKGAAGHAAETAAAAEGAVTGFARVIEGPMAEAVNKRNEILARQFPEADLAKAGYDPNAFVDPTTGEVVNPMPVAPEMPEEIAGVKLEDYFANVKGREATVRRNQTLINQGRKYVEAARADVTPEYKDVQGILNDLRNMMLEPIKKGEAEAKKLLPKLEKSVAETQAELDHIFGAGTTATTRGGGGEFQVTADQLAQYLGALDNDISSIEEALRNKDRYFRGQLGRRQKLVEPRLRAALETLYATRDKYKAMVSTLPDELRAEAQLRETQLLGPRREAESVVEQIRQEAERQAGRPSPERVQAATQQLAGASDEARAAARDQYIAAREMLDHPANVVPTVDPGDPLLHVGDSVWDARTETQDRIAAVQDEMSRKPLAGKPDEDRKALLARLQANLDKLDSHEGKLRVAAKRGELRTIEDRLDQLLTQTSRTAAEDEEITKLQWRLDHLNARNVPATEAPAAGPVRKTTAEILAPSPAPTPRELPPPRVEVPRSWPKMRAIGPEIRNVGNEDYDAYRYAQDRLNRLARKGALTGAERAEQADLQEFLDYLESGRSTPAQPGELDAIEKRITLLESRTRELTANERNELERLKFRRDAINAAGEPLPPAAPDISLTPPSEVAAPETAAPPPEEPAAPVDRWRQYAGERTPQVLTREPSGRLSAEARAEIEKARRTIAAAESEGALQVPPGVTPPEPLPPAYETPGGRAPLPGPTQPDYVTTRAETVEQRTMRGGRRVPTVTAAERQGVIGSDAYLRDEARLAALPDEIAAAKAEAGRGRAPVAPEPTPPPERHPVGTIGRAQRISDASGRYMVSDGADWYVIRKNADGQWEISTNEGRAATTTQRTLKKVEEAIDRGEYRTPTPEPTAPPKPQSAAQRARIANLEKEQAELQAKFNRGGEHYNETQARIVLQDEADAIAAGRRAAEGVAHPQDSRAQAALVARGAAAQRELTKVRMLTANLPPTETPPIPPQQLPGRTYKFGVTGGQQRGIRFTPTPPGLPPQTEAEAIQQLRGAAASGDIANYPIAQHLAYLEGRIPAEEARLANIQAGGIDPLRDIGMPMETTQQMMGAPINVPGQEPMTVAEGVQANITNRQLRASVEGSIQARNDLLEQKGIGLQGKLAADTADVSRLEAQRQTAAEQGARLKGIHPRDTKRSELEDTIAALEEIARANPNLDEPALNATESILQDQRERLSLLGQKDLTRRQVDQMVYAATKGRLGDVMLTGLNDTWRKINGATGPLKEGDIIIQRHIGALFQNLLVIDRHPNAFGRLFAGLTNLFKTYATLTPGFHVRNALSGIFMNTADGVGLAQQIEGTKLYGKWMKGGDEWLKTRSPRIQQAFKAVWSTGAAGRFGEAGVAEASSDIHTQMINRIYDFLASNKATLWSQKWGERVEGALRLGMALDTLDRGATIDDAIDRITRVHFDYSQISNADKFMKQIIPFWTFMSRNLPLQVSQMWMQPRTYLQYQSLIRNFSKDNVPYTPQYWLDAGAWNTGLKVPQNNLPVVGAASGLPIYLSPDLGVTRLSGDIGDIQEFMSNPAGIASEGNPLFTSAIEYGTHTNLYTGQHYGAKDFSKVSGPMNIPINILSYLIPGQRNAAGEVSKNLQNAIEAWNPLIARQNKLIPQISGNDPEDLKRQLESIARVWGVPVRTLTPEQQDQEFLSRYYDLQDKQKAQEAMLRRQLERQGR